MPIKRICENCDGVFYIKPYVVKIGKAHFFSFAGFPEERFELDNGATLCIPCHDRVRKNEPSA